MNLENGKKQLKERLTVGCNDWAEFIILTLAGMLIGLITVLFEYLYQNGLNWALNIHQKTNPWILVSLPFAGLLITWMFHRFGGLSRHGMNLVFEISQGKQRWIPKRTIPLTMIATWISNLCGASVGREGVAMQIGAAVSSFINRHTRGFENERTIFLVAGMAAGFAGLFGTPYTAVFFALEVLEAGVLKFRALPSAAAAALTASWVGSMLNMGAEINTLPVLAGISSPENALRFLALGLLCGLVGGSFAWVSRMSRRFFRKYFPNPYKRMMIFGSLAAVLLALFFQGRYSNFGTNLIEAAFTWNHGALYPWDWLLKMVLTILCLSIGFVGGEVTPLFAVGASLGFFAGPFFGIHPLWGAAIGYAAVFGSGTNTWLAPIMVGVEIFGFGGFPAFFISCSAAYLINRSQSIYSLQKTLDEKQDMHSGSSPCE